MTARILMVDDEPRVLDGFRRALNGRYALTVADSGSAALEKQAAALGAGAPFPVIVSDMMMPGMNGAAFLAAAREADPDVVALVLSGQADLESTIAAVNHAGLFGFLTKPCDSGTLGAALDRALAQYALVRAERELLERTVRGAVDVLADLVAAASPAAFTRTLRIRNLCTEVSADLGLQRDWRLPLAARLAQVGCLSIPQDVVGRAYRGGRLTGEERALYRGHPGAAQAMIGRIPRLEEVAQWVGGQPIDPADPVPAGASGPQLVFHLACAYVAAFESLADPVRAAEAVHRSGHYPAELLHSLARARHVLVRSVGVPRMVTVSQIRLGMELQQDVVTRTGMTLVRRGEPVTDTLAVRLVNFARTVGVVEPISVLDFE